MHPEWSESLYLKVGLFYTLFDRVETGELHVYYCGDCESFGIGFVCVCYSKIMIYLQNCPYVFVKYCILVVYRSRSPI